MANDKELAIRQFDTMTRYYAFETTMYWTRSHFFMVANAGLLALVAAYFLEPTLDHPLILMMVCGVGIFLSVCWLSVLRSGQFWTDRWEKICLILEPMAMGEIEVFRNCRDNRHFSTKKIARVTAACFIVVWCAASVLAFVNGVVVHPTDKTLKQKNASQSNAGGK